MNQSILVHSYKDIKLFLSQGDLRGEVQRGFLLRYRLFIFATLSCGLRQWLKNNPLLKIQRDRTVNKSVETNKNQ